MSWSHLSSISNDENSNKCGMEDLMVLRWEKILIKPKPLEQRQTRPGMNDHESSEMQWYTTNDIGSIIHGSILIHDELHPILCDISFSLTNWLMASPGAKSPPALLVHFLYTQKPVTITHFYPSLSFPLLILLFKMGGGFSRSTLIVTFELALS